MKNAAKYEKKIKVLLKGTKRLQASQPPTGQEATAVLVQSVLESETTDNLAQNAMETIRREYVDLNELRVSPTKDIVDCVGRDFPLARAKAQTIKAVLEGVYTRAYDVTIDHMASMPKKDLRRHLEELGLDQYAAACVVLKVFGGHAIPVDETLVDALKIGECVDPDSDRDDVQGFLTRIISHRNAPSAHQRLREYVVKSAKAVAKMRKARAEAQAKAEAEARAKAEAEAAARQAEEAARKAAEAAKAARKKEAKKARKAKATAKKMAKKAKRAKKSAGKAPKAGSARPARSKRTARTAKKAVVKKASRRKDSRKTVKKAAKRRARKKT